MARQLVFANGHLHVGLNEFGLVHDLYFPRVGLESHIAPSSLAHKVGVYVDGALSWLDSGDWVVSIAYHDGTMVGDTVATNNNLGLRVEFTDVVDYQFNLWARSIHVMNLWDIERPVKLYCHQAFTIGESTTSDSAQYRPDLPGIMHYKGNRVFLASLKVKDRYFDDFSIGKFDVEGGYGTYRDAEDGLLDKNLVENGRVDSVMGVELTIGASASARADYSLLAAESVEDVEIIFENISKAGLAVCVERTANYWRDWLLRAAVPRDISDEQRQALNTSLLVVKAHINSEGAVMASLDSSLKNHPQDDAYNFCWGRDAAYALWPLVRLGYNEEFLGFMEFTKRTISQDGYLHHKYRADGSLGSTWLPYSHPNGDIHPPIQVDETALVLFLAGQYFRQTGDHKFLAEYYSSVLAPMANFLSSYVDEDGMPLPSYDPWEHDYLTHTHTTAVTYASLIEAVELADAFGRENDKKIWGTAADKILAGSSVFYNEEKSYFYRGYLRGKNGEKQFDDTVDILSLYGAFMFGIFDPRGEQVKSAIDTANRVLSDGRGFSRFERDDYYQADGQPNIWLNVSLWMAQIRLELDQLPEAERILNFVMSLASPSGMLPEQVERTSLKVASLSPLVWSHAELVNTLIDYWQTKRS